MLNYNIEQQSSVLNKYNRFQYEAYVLNKICLKIILNMPLLKGNFKIMEDFYDF